MTERFPSGRQWSEFDAPLRPLRGDANRPVQRRLLFPLIVVLLLLVGGFDALLLRSNYDHIHRASRTRLNAVANDLKKTLAQQSENLEGIGSTLLHDSCLTATLKAGNTGRLLADYEPFFDMLRAKCGITHFYFHRADRVNLLRLHMPGRYGDLIDRFTLREAERTGKAASGIELGPMGTFTLRVVVPAFDGDTLIGYIELGKEIEDILRSISEEPGIEVAASIRKSALQRQNWEAGMKMLGREAHWDRFADDAIIYASAGRFPEAAGRLVSEDTSEHGVLQDVGIDDNPWHVMTSSLLDASGADVGDLFVFHDVTDATAQFHATLLVSSGVALGLATTLVLFLCAALRRVDRGIEMQRELETQHHEIKVANASLEMSCQVADTATRAKSEFLANMSHEIRTPMTAILGFAENMADAEQSQSEKLSCVHTIRRNGEYLLGLINDILDLSKIEAGKMEVEQRDCEPCRIVAEVASLMRVRADAKGLPFDVEYIGAVPETIQTDPTRLRQILINLIGNAIKFTETGGVRIVTRLVRRGETPCLQFDVIDTGRGLTEEQVAELFQPFTQADKSTARLFGGTGLGLTISKHFAELLGGDITVAATELGIGTTFRVTVTTGPLDGVTMLERPTSATVAAGVAATDARLVPTDLRGIRILLAEDGPDNQKLIAFILTQAGADVTVEENGKLAIGKALAAINRRRHGDPECPYDIILMDMQMPVMDGYEATAQLRRTGYSGPIIALTAHAMSSDREKCLNAGCNDYATKPIDRKKLIETIQRHLAPTEAVVRTGFEFSPCHIRRA